MEDHNGPITVREGDCLTVMADLPDNSIDAICTDPPYGLSNTNQTKVIETITHWVTGDRTYIPKGAGFMGRAWDAFVPPVAVWDQALRILKPGGYALVFAGSRTQDLMALALRLAGFDIQDAIAWIYGSGFPKSLNVTQAVEHYQQHGPAQLEYNGQEIRPGVYEVTTYLRNAREKAGWTNQRIDALFGTNGMAGHWTTLASQPAVPSTRQWAILKEHLGFGDDMDELVEQLASTERPEDWGTTAAEDKAFLDTLQKDPAAVGVRGYGTALKPAYEPIICARKPLQGNYATNIMQHGTGALNIAECGIGDEGGFKVLPGQLGKGASKGVYGDGLNNQYYGTQIEGLGRWPANVTLDETQAEKLNHQMPATNGADIGASRFFYVAKPTPEERMSVDGVTHPTQKPVTLMRWLIRLVTPKGGLVLDPFAGSGTTAEAALREGFRCIAIEREPAYIPHIQERLKRGADPAKYRDRKQQPDQLDLFEGTEL